MIIANNAAEKLKFIQMLDRRLIIKLSIIISTLSRKTFFKVEWNVGRKCWKSVPRYLRVIKFQ